MKLKNMKLTICLALGVLLLCAVFVQTTRADEKRDAKIKAEMIENYLLWQVALKIQDAERIISFESPDFTVVMPDGESRPKSVADLTIYFWANNSKEIRNAKVEIKKLIIDPQRVVILSRRFFDGKITGPDDLLHSFALTINARDIWVNYDGAWMLKRTELLDTEHIFDGNPHVNLW